MFRQWVIADLFGSWSLVSGLSGTRGHHWFKTTQYNVKQGCRWFRVWSNFKQPRSHFVPSKHNNGSHTGKKAAVWKRFIKIMNSFPRGEPLLLHGALTPEVSERWASLYLQRIERMGLSRVPAGPEGYQVQASIPWKCSLSSVSFHSSSPL